ncbi:uncharacterized protein LOC104421631 [Eucalyptus grandis]|uniref:Uncharacterized protein n=3 Tax=Eucalyptus TaxID=3932 RepID=A0ACC3J4V0_EUCGR|nr:uncharacterized protein LOC104421631 [Eucalyptus grandis]KAK3408716.1 hypothetical protein EUGRSUZ_J00897 [Eucalyptus grandis]
MELAVVGNCSPAFLNKTSRESEGKVYDALTVGSCFPAGVNVRYIRQRKRPVSSALPETAISIAVAAAAVGAATTLLIKRTKASEETEIPMKTCETCGGSGICSECKGEGFVLKRLSEASAEKARLTAKNMATRYTAALPKKWSYCTKCSSSRSCIACGGRGKLSL